MKLIVDYMPIHPSKCPYAEDHCDMDHDEYVCTWNKRQCLSTEECPFFKGKE